MATVVPHLHDTQGHLSFCWDRLCAEIQASEERISWAVGTTVIGGIAGGLIGKLYDKPAEGALLGGLVGAVVGALTDGS